MSASDARRGQPANAALGVPELLLHIGSYLSGQDRLSLALANKESHKVLSSLLCERVSLRLRGKERVALLLQRDEAGSQRASFVKNLDVGNVLFLHALRPANLCSDSSAILSLTCTIEGTSGFAAFCFLSLPKLVRLDLTVKRYLEGDVNPVLGSAGFGFPALRRLAFRPGSYVAAGALLYVAFWNGFAVGCPCLEDIELDLRSFSREDDVMPFPSTRPPAPLLPALRTVTVSWARHLARMAELFGAGLMLKKISVVRVDKPPSWAAFATDFEASWPSLCKSAFVVEQLEISFYAARWFALGFPRGLKRLHVGLLDFDCAVPDGPVEGLELTADGYMLRGSVVGRKIAKLMAMDKW